MSSSSERGITRKFFGKNSSNSLSEQSVLDKLLDQRKAFRVAANLVNPIEVTLTFAPQMQFTGQLYDLSQLGMRVEIPGDVSRKFRRGDLLVSQIDAEQFNLLIKSPFEVHWSIYEEIFESTYIGGLFTAGDAKVESSLEALVNELKNA